MTYKAKLLLGLGLIAIAASIIFFLAQKSRHAAKEIVMDGGPCVYDTLVAPARIIKVDFYDSLHVNLYFEIKVKDDPADTTDLQRQYGSPYRFLLKKDMEHAGIAKGDTLGWTCYRIISGTCSPKMYTASLEKYHKENGIKTK